MAISSVPQGVNVATIALGPMLIGFLFHCVFLGIFFVQVYLWAREYLHKDKRWIKIFVFTIAAGNVIHTALIMADIYISLITHFGDSPFLIQATWLFSSGAALTGIIGTMVQMFFLWRVKLLTGTWWYVIVIAAASLAGLGGALAASVEISMHPHFFQFVLFKDWVIIWLVFSCVADIMITAILVWFLRGRKTGIRETDVMVDRVIKGAIETGLITTLSASIDLLTYLFVPNGFHLIFSLSLAKLYANMLMSSLNARGSWFRRNNSGVVEEYQRSISLGAQSHVSIGETVSHKNDIVRIAMMARPEVFIHVESHEKRDDKDGTDISSVVDISKSGKSWKSCGDIV